MDLNALAPALGLDAARAMDPSRYAMSGTSPRLAVRPVTRDEVTEVLRAAARDRLGVVPWGGGVALVRESAPEGFDVALDLSGLDRVVEYDPEDFTVTAECGVRIETLRATLAARGQELPIEAPEAWGATLGGTLAANASGPRRLRFGAPRDRVLGARFCLGDGTLARTGGRVVKNVAGYAIHRLLCGSRGGLGVILEASLKLAPAPESRAALVYGVAAARIADPATWSRFPRLEPAYLTVIGRAAAELNPVLAAQADFTVVVGFEDDTPWVERQIERTHEALGPARLQVTAESAAKLLAMLTDLEELQGARLGFTSAHNTPAALAPLVGTKDAERLVFHAPAGRLHVFPTEGDAAPLVSRLAEAGFTRIDARGLALDPAATAPQPAIGSLRERLRSALDPSGVLAMGPRWLAQS
jgi:FAD/FMN-containing dehydrogenase